MREMKANVAIVLVIGAVLLIGVGGDVMGLSQDAIISLLVLVAVSCPIIDKWVMS